MRRSHLSIGPAVAGCLLLAVTSCNDEPETEAGFSPTESTAAVVSQYDIVKVPSMTIDGNLADWASITEISIADNSGRPAGQDNTAKIRLAWNDTYLFAAYDVTDTELLALQTARDNGDIFKDDEIELFIDPQGDGAGATSMTTTDYQFLANIREALRDERGNGSGGKDASYNAASFLAQAVANGTVNAAGADVGYAIELRIAWSDLGVTPAAGHFMRMDLAVGDRDGAGPPPVHGFDWAGLTLYNNPSGWKDVQLVDPPPPSDYDIVKVPSMTIDGNLGDWAGVASISMADDPANGRGALNNSATVRLAWNDTYLFAAYNVTDTELLALQTARDNGDIFKDDEIELFIDPQGDGGSATSMTTTDYQFLSNIREALRDERGNGSGGKDASYNAASFLAQAVLNGSLNGGGADVGYAIELRIAWSDLGVTPAAGRFMRMDLAVGDRDGAGPPPVHGFDWAGLALYNNPSAWKGVRLTVDGTAPAAPTNLALSVVSSSRIDVSWTASSSTDVNKYNIFRGTTGTPALLTSVAGSPFQNTGLAAGTSYTYQVSAVDAAGNQSARTPAQSATTQSAQGGIPFGLFALHPDTLNNGTIWTGAGLASKHPPSLLASLRAARDKSPRIGMWVTMSGGDETVFHGPNGFQLEEWKDSVDRAHAPDTLANGVSTLYDDYLPFIENGTFQGILLLDDLGAFDPYPTRAQIEAMAAHAKRRFPALPTAVRDRPVRLEQEGGSAPFTKLDVSWAQYRSDQPAAPSYRDQNIAAAQRLQLGLVLGINLRHGLRIGPDGTTVPPDSLLKWGNAFLQPGASDYVCGFIMWDTRYQHVNHANMTTLANKAKTHVSAPCKRR